MEEAVQGDAGAGHGSVLSGQKRLGVAFKIGTINDVDTMTNKSSMDSGPAGAAGLSSQAAAGAALERLHRVAVHDAREWLRLVVFWLVMQGFAGWAAPAPGPLRVHPVNSRYFTDGTKNADGSFQAVYLAGAHTW